MLDMNEALKNGSVRDRIFVLLDTFVATKLNWKAIFGVKFGKEFLGEIAKLDC